MTTTLQKIIEEQFQVHKDIQIQDIYKLLYQGTFGCEHLFDQNVEDVFRKEYKDAPLMKEDPVMEHISPTFMIIRVNIRPYKFYGGKEEFLYEWFEESSRIQEGTDKDFFTFWKVFKGINKEESYFHVKEVEKYEKMFNDYYKTESKLPIIHHSKGYRDANNPCYRVINLKAVYNITKKKLAKK